MKISVPFLFCLIWKSNKNLIKVDFFYSRLGNLFCLFSLYNYSGILHACKIFTFRSSEFIHLGIQCNIEFLFLIYSYPPLYIT